MSTSGWFPQPDGRERYYDGERWTDEYRTAQGGGAAQPAYRATPPPPPQRKSSVWKWVLIILVVALIACCGGFAACTAGIVGTADEVNKAIEAEESEEGGTGNPKTITEGEAFEVRGFEYASGWELTESLGSMDITGLKVTNNREKRDSALVDIKLMKGSEVLASADCTTDPIQPGETVTLSCFSADDLPSDYDEITINDSF